MFNTSMHANQPETSVMKPKKKKAKAAGGGGLSSMRGAANSSSLSDLQSVEEFRHFLLRNDS